MLESIQDVLAAEERAGKTVDDAKAEALQRQAAFSEEESTAMRDAQAQADTLLRERIAALRAEHAQRIQEAEERLRREAAERESEVEPLFDAAIGRAVALILTGETGTDEE